MSDPSCHEAVDYDVQEHGARWAVCSACGAEWGIHDSTRGEVYEQVSDGDGTCEERAE